MPPRKTYIDSGVLIKAHQGKSALAKRAIDILDDPDRQFLSSTFVQLETLPKAVYHKNQDELDFYQAFFTSVSQWVTIEPTLLDEALRQANTFGLAGVDALHVASALLLGAEDLVTSEKPTKPIFRVTGLTVISIHS
jgi:predicted nucleic acid-binding protein